MCYFLSLDPSLSPLPLSVCLYLSLCKNNVCMYMCINYTLSWVHHPDELQGQRNRMHVLSVVPISAGIATGFLLRMV